MGNVPLVSIVIPNYNRKELISSCLKSIVATRYANYEVIIVDDWWVFPGNTKI